MRAAQKKLVWAGVLVLVLTNAVALTGVAYNRMNPPDSVLTLTERELGPEWSWMWWGEENSGLSVQLQLRTEFAPDPMIKEPQGWQGFATYAGFGRVRWLDRDKLAALGFDVNMAPTEEGSEKHYGHMLGREVLLVLEFDGPTYDRALQDTRDRLARLEQKTAGEPDNKGVNLQLQNAREDLQSEEHNRSRLFIVDAGLDEASLRQRYPDRSHYAIVRGNVRPDISGDRTAAKLYGRVTAVHCESIHVPLHFHAAAPGRPSQVHSPIVPHSESKQPLTVQVAFGRRFEPWIVSARAGP
jgi:hypothetical protein